MSGTGGPRDAQPLIERDDELATIDACIASADAGLGGALVVEGPSGVGISALLSAAIGAARARDMRAARVLGAAGGGRPQRVRRLDAPDASRSLVVVDASGPARRPRVDLSDPSALVLVVDDAHEADATTLAGIAELARAFRGRRALLVAGARAADGAVADIARGATVLRPRPLGAAGTATLLARELGRPLSPELAGVAARVTGGMPRLLVELATEVLHAGVAADAHPDDGFREVAERVVARMIRRRIGEPDAIAVAEVVAILDRWATPSRVASLVARPAPAVHPVLDGLVDGGVLSRAAPPAFARASDRAAILRSTRLVRCQQVRAAAAVLLGREGEALGAGMLVLEVDPSGDGPRCDVLRAAAASALDDERPDLAIRLITRLIAEPVSEEGRTEALVMLGTTQVRAGLDRGMDTLRDALNAAVQPRDISEAAAALGWALAGRAHGEDAAAALLRGRARVTADARGLGVALDVQIAEMSGWDAALKPARRAALARLAAATDSPLAVAATVAAQATDAFAVAQPASGVASLCQRALADGALADSPRGAPTALSTAMVLGYAGHPRVGIDHIDHAITRLRANDMPQLVWPATAFRGALKLMLGRLADAEHDLRAVVAAPWLVRSTPLTAGFLILCLLERADDDGAAKLVADLDLEGGDLQELIPHAPLLHARGELRARRGDPHAALDDLRACGRRLADGGWVNPAVAWWRGSAARILMTLGEPDEARALAAEELRLAELFAVPAVLCRALRARAATVSPPQARALLGRAVAITDAAQAPIEHVGALVELAAAEIDAGAAARARPHLHAALALARDIGAETTARRAADLLHAAGGRAHRADSRGPGALTRAERRVALLAAEGRTNTEICSELVVSRKTVESHLRSVFRKLGIGSRAQLPEMLARDA